MSSQLHSREHTDAIAAWDKPPRKDPCFLSKDEIISSFSLHLFKKHFVMLDTVAKETEINIKRSHPLGTFNVGTIFQATSAENLNCPKHCEYKDRWHTVPDFRNITFLVGGQACQPSLWKLGGLE